MVYKEHLLDEVQSAFCGITAIILLCFGVMFHIKQLALAAGTISGGLFLLSWFNVMFPNVSGRSLVTSLALPSVVCVIRYFMT